ncbi:DUF4093 domain-containing protein, partial [Frankia sp. Cpl3]|nr:DUF4093 domain-containing protein [Frankia sp. Cpl3]
MKKGDIGVENASPEVIIRALSKVRTEMAEQAGEITFDDMVAFGLTSGTDSKQRRLRLGERLGIGYANAKQLLNRLNAFQISREEFLNAAES